MEVKSPLPLAPRPHVRMRGPEPLNVLRAGRDPVLSRPVGQLPIRQVVTNPTLPQRAGRHIHQVIHLPLTGASPANRLGPLAYFHGMPQGVVNSVSRGVAIPDRAGLAAIIKETRF